MQRVLATLPKVWENEVQSAMDMLKSKGYSVELVWSDNGLPEEELIRLIKGKHAYIVCVDTVSKRVIEHADSLKVLAKHGVGVDNIDIKAATEKKIAVCNTPGANAHAVADLTLGLIIEITRKLSDSDKLARKGIFSKPTGIELNKKTLGIIGFGAIGKQVAIRARAFGLEILAYDMIHDDSFADEYGVKYSNIDEILNNCDILTLHLPLTPETKGLINREAIKKMKKTAYIVNAARGGIVDEDAVADALINGELQGAAFDVFSKEPPDLNSKIFSAPNVHFCTHIAGSTIEAIQRGTEMAAQNVIDFLEGKAVKSVVNCFT